MRDEDTGRIVGPTALPIRDETASYLARHGWGYSRFEHNSHGVAAELLEFVPLADPVKISRLTLRNTTNRPRRLSVTAYVEWVLGASRTAHRALCDHARSIRKPAPCSPPTPGPRPSPPASPSPTLAAGRPAWTGDRREFLGRNGALSRPAGLALVARFCRAVLARASTPAPRCRR